MSFFMWLSAILIAQAGVLLSGVFAESDRGGFVLLIGLAALAATWASRRASATKWNYVQGPLYVFCAVAAMACTAPLLLRLAARGQDLGAIAPMAGLLARLFGADLEVENGTLYSNQGDLVVLTTNWAKVGVLPVIWTLLSAAVMLCCYRRPRPLKALAVTSALVVGFGLIRYAFLVILVLHHPEPINATGRYPFAVDVFVEPHWQAITFLPLALFLARFLPWTSGDLRWRCVDGARLRWHFVAGALAVAIGGSWAVSSNLGTWGPRTGNRIMIDEGHSPDWSSTVAPLDTEHYGRDTVYSYTSLVRLLDQYYDLVLNLDEAYSEATLADVDVLILRTATRPFTQSEVDAIDDFVRRGGGLFVIGDHTNLLGMSTNLNAVTARFGMSFRFDACNQLEDGGVHHWRPLPWEAHPITAGIERIDFQTSCTLQIPAGAEPLLVVRNAFSDPLDYGADSFFGNVAPDLDDDLGVHIVAASNEVGAGRVVLFGDSTIFSSFGLTLHGRSEFLLQSVGWLSHGGGSGAVRILVCRWLSVASALALLMILLTGRAAGTWVVLVPAGLAAGVSAAMPGVRAWHGEAYALQAAVRPMLILAFVEEGCALEIPSPLHASPIQDEDAFDVLFTWPQRLGQLPVLASLAEALEQRAMVIVQPEVAFVENSGVALERYVRGGGAAMVLSETPEVVAMLASIFDLATDELGIKLVSKPLDGAESAVDIDGNLSATRAFRYGEGILLHVSQPTAFSRLAMGSQIDEIGEEDYRIPLFNELYGLLRLLMNPA